MNEPLRAALLAGRRRPRLGGVGSPTNYRGDGYEFVELREYVHGDDPRRIDWAATARSGALQTRVVLEDVALTLAAIVDRSGSMRVGRRREISSAANEALAAWYGAVTADDRCIRVHETSLIAPPLRGRAAAAVCVQDAPGETGAAFDVERALRVALAALPRGAALLMITDAFGAADASDGSIASVGARFDCTVLVARDPWYDGVPLRGMTRVRDSETGRTARLVVGANERARLRAAVAEREDATKRRYEFAGWRAGVLRENDGRASLLGAFGIAS